MILVIDGNNLANMCSYSKGTLINSAGLSMTTVNMFMMKLYNMYDSLYPDSIIICWDKKITRGVKNFRKDDGKYKAQRTGDNEELFKQCDIIEELVGYLGIRNIHPNVMEADDIMAWIAHHGAGDEKVIVATFDKDLLQLVSDNVEYFDLRKKHKITVANFEQIVNIKRTRFLLYKMILGDQSDNIAGLKGYGKVKAKKMAELESPFESITQDQRELLIKNKKLMDLKVGYTVYPDEVEVYKEQYDNIPEKNFDKFYICALENNIQYIKDYKWKWEDLCLNS